MSSLPLLRVVIDTNVVLGQASDDEIESVLATRELVEPEAELSSDVVARLQERILKRA
jgi:hypothetical protein